MSTRAIRHLPLKITNMVRAVKAHNVNAPRQALRTPEREILGRALRGMHDKFGGLDGGGVPTSERTGAYWAIGLDYAICSPRSDRRCRREENGTGKGEMDSEQT